MNVKRIHFLLVLLLISIGSFVFFNIQNGKDASGPIRSAEPNWLVKKYGAKHFSQNDEELIIRDFFQDKRNGIFVDIGANHYKINSTTYYLESDLGWNGIAVDAICDYKKEYELYRKNTLFFCFYISNRSDDMIDFYINEQNKRISTSIQDLAIKQGNSAKVRIATITLNDLLAQTGIKHLDFLSMDIELSEPAALAGFDIQKYSPSLVCIEAHNKVRKQILEYFTKNNYLRIESYNGLDPLNYYFARGPEMPPSKTVNSRVN